MYILGYVEGTSYLAVFLGGCDAGLGALAGHPDSILRRTLVGINPVEPCGGMEGGRGGVKYIATTLHVPG